MRARIRACCKEPLVGSDLLLQFLHLALSGSTLGFPQTRRYVRGALPAGEIGERILKAPDLSLCDSVLFFVLDHFRLRPPSRIATITAIEVDGMLLPGHGTAVEVNPSTAGF